MQRREIFKGFALALGVVATRPLAASFSQENSEDKVQPPLDPNLQKRMQQKIENFDTDFPDDIYLTPEKFKLLKQVQSRLARAQEAIGFARFNLLSFDELLKSAANMSQIGPFATDEMSFVEEIFFYDARNYGFYGEKVTDKLTARFDEKDAVKIPGSGHYIFRGRPEALYQEIVRDVGSDIVLTSGIRSVVKQLHLFLSKAIACQGNLSRASRSLAPPGHSYHGISDFDVGKLGWGYRNFTDHFAKSDVFKRLIDLGYVDIRYTPNNSYGVRFEPWHIKVG
ncbi:MAG TPA: D-alanyl-D-alanine carboxypeptidase family protein [Oligoflexus sp.]|uniref:D-alanyl-D-alanine carboxypeptidase family protein n=1 Tax=Oligoflexus sp. TaxID=1971216 RepID=UPI002D80D2A4|nr:D-alanyl-D-alanine carboxypeptidase family protein [Oligoflexus sp.]HET9241509.1 D-alanyl-D-alanine carboxypeptidase family protein [Oligoflexus sp.]